MKSFREFLLESQRDVGGGWHIHTNTDSGFKSIKKTQRNPVAKAYYYQNKADQERKVKAEYDANYLNRDKEAIITHAKSIAKYGHNWDAQNQKDKEQFGRSYRPSKEEHSKEVLAKAANWDKQRGSNKNDLTDHVKHILSLPHDHPELADFN